MPHIRIVLRAIAFPCGINSFFREEVIHGLGTGAEEILAGSGDIGWRVTAGDGLHDPEAGIVIGKPLAQIVELDTLSGGSCPLSHVIHTAV